MKMPLFPTKAVLLPSLLVTLLSNSLFLSAQVTADLPRIMKPSPEASSLFRYQDYPVDYSTGVPDISVLIYTIQSGTLTVPISMSYHASGRKVYDQDGPVALGWNLNAGGMVSATVYGAVDFGTAGGTYKFPYPFNTTNITNYNNICYLENFVHYGLNADSVSVATWLDGEYDIYSYYFPGGSGKFIFRDSNNIKIPMLIPDKPYVITPHTNSVGLATIDIVDDKGILYTFTAGETTQQNQSPIETLTAFTGYYLTKMISADKSDTISFLYTGFSQTRTTISQQIVWNDNETGLPGGPNDIIPEGPTMYETTSQNPYQMLRLTEIDFRQGKVMINLVSGTDKVDNIQVLNNANTVIRNVKFNRSSMDNMSEVGYSTNKLDSLCFKDKNGVTVERYSFDYFSSYNAPTQLNVRYRDWWGYYNGSGVHDMVPYYTNLNYVGFSGTGGDNTHTIGNPSAGRDPNILGLESGMLKKITYPTGGSTSFTYEGNSYYNYSTQQVTGGPGMRVSQIVTDDGSGATSTRTFKYGANESGYGYLDMTPDMTNMAVENIYNHFTIGMNDVTYYYRERIFYSDFMPFVSALAERPVIYTTVTEYQGTPTDNTGKTIYTYNYDGWALSGMPSFESSTIQKKHIYDYNYYDVPFMTRSQDYRNTSTNGVASYQLKKQEDYSFIMNPTVTAKGLHVQRVHVLSQTDRVLGPPPIYAEPYGARYANPLLQVYTFNEYHISGGYKLPSGTTTTLYNDDNTTTVSTASTTYNPYRLPNLTTRTTSDGAAINTAITYPFDYSGNTVLNQMVSSNMLDFPVEKNMSRNTTPLQGARMNYFNWGSTAPLINPQTTDVKKGSNAYETRMHFYGYDKYGNLLTISKELGVHVSYIWDYNSSYAIAECTNADTSDIAYTSFEADGKGRWTFSGTAVADAAARTGSYSYNLNSGAITSSGLNTTKTFIVSYWSKSGSATVNGTAATGMFSNNGWTYFEHKLPASTSSVTVSGSVTIDELRLYPANAQMVTSTYIPLVGVSSRCSADNSLEFYDYDNYWRLKRVRDINGNIIKTYNYHDQSDSILP